MLKIASAALLLLLIPTSTALEASVLGIHRELRGMRGYAIIGSASVLEKVEDRSGERYLRLDNGEVYRLGGYSYAYVGASVIIFGKRLPEELLAEYKGKVPDAVLYSIRLLIEDEMVDGFRSTLSR